MREYFDTPVLVFAAGSHELGAKARRLISDAEVPLATPHALAECFNALTYRLGLPPSEARRLIAANTARFEFVTMEAAGYRDAIKSVVDNGLTGQKIYDALHVKAAIKGRADKLHTSNRRDFDALKPEIPVEKIGL